MMKAGFRVSSLKDAKVMNFLSNYTFKTNEVVDWYASGFQPCSIHVRSKLEPEDLLQSCSFVWADDSAEHES